MNQLTKAESLRSFPIAQKSILLCGLALGLVLLPAIAVEAAPLYKGQSVWRVLKKNGWHLVLAGNPNTIVEYVVPRTRRQYRYTGADVCGFAAIKLPTSPLKELEANGQLLDIHTLPSVNENYNCTVNSERANIAVNSYNPQTKTVYFQAGWRAAVQFTWLQFDSGKATLNSCGYSEIFLAGVDEGTAIVNGQSYQFESLPTAPHPLACRSVEGVSVLYIPNGF
jgi:hypothetical protein